MSFGTMFFFFLVWMAGHLFFGTMDGETMGVFTQFGSDATGLSWLTTAKSMMMFPYDILDTNVFFKILRAILIIAGTIFFILIVLEVMKIMSYLFSGAAGMLGGLRGIIRR